MVTKTESGRRASESWKISPYRTIGGQQNLHISEDAQCFFSVSVSGMTLEHYLQLVSKTRVMILHIWAEQKLTIEGKTKLMISWSTTFLPASRTDLADHSFWNVQKTTVGCCRNQGESSKEVPKLIRTLKKKGHGNLWKVMWKVDACRAWLKEPAKEGTIFPGKVDKVAQSQTMFFCSSLMLKHYSSHTSLDEATWQVIVCGIWSC